MVILGGENGSRKESQSLTKSKRIPVDCLVEKGLWEKDGSPVRGDLFYQGFLSSPDTKFPSLLFFLKFIRYSAHLFFADVERGRIVF